jgi:hypothetical protein
MNEQSIVHHVRLAICVRHAKFVVYTTVGRCSDTCQGERTRSELLMM